MNDRYEKYARRAEYALYLQIGLIVASVAMWITVVFGPLVTSWYFLLAMATALTGLYRVYAGNVANEAAANTIAEGESGTFRVLAEFGHPMKPANLSNFVPHSIDETRSILNNLERKGMVRSEIHDEDEYYYVLSTRSNSTEEVPESVAGETKEDGTEKSVDKEVEK